MDPAAIPHQGCTLRPDLLIAGARVFSDAYGKCKKTPAAAGTTVTGIGVFLQYGKNGQNFNVMTQAFTTLLPSVLQDEAEANALLLVVKLAELLQIFLTDNQVFAKAAASRTLDHALLLFYIGMPDKYLQIPFMSQAQAFHISRDLNGVAHNSVHQVLREDLSQSIYS